MAGVSTNRFQFSIRLMLVATALFAVAAWSVTCGPSLPSVVAMPAVAAFFASIGTVAYCGTIGRVKAFWLGVTIPLAVDAFVASFEIRTLVWSWLQQNSADFSGELPLLYDGARYTMLGYLSFAPLNGLLCALIHWLIWPDAPHCGDGSEIPISK